MLCVKLLLVTFLFYLVSHIDIVALGQNIVALSLLHNVFIRITLLHSYYVLHYYNRSFLKGKISAFHEAN